MSRETRSRVMSRIRGKDTSPELIVRRYLHSKGLRYRLHSKKLLGKPDIVFPSRKVVVFVHGCFWHAHQHCDAWRMPQSRTDFWQAKLLGNRNRDERNARKLRDQGWRVTTIWECDLANEKLEQIYRFIIRRC